MRKFRMPQIDYGYVVKTTIIIVILLIMLLANLAACVDGDTYERYESETGAAHYHLTIDGMDCVSLTSAGSLTCNWAQFNPDH